MWLYETFCQKSLSKATWKPTFEPLNWRVASRYTFGVLKFHLPFTKLISSQATFQRTKNVPFFDLRFANHAGTYPCTICCEKEQWDCSSFHEDKWQDLKKDRPRLDRFGWHAAGARKTLLHCALCVGDKRRSSSISSISSTNFTHHKLSLFGSPKYNHKVCRDNYH